MLRMGYGISVFHGSPGRRWNRRHTIAYNTKGREAQESVTLVGSSMVEQSLGEPHRARSEVELAVIGFPVAFDGWELTSERRSCVRHVAGNPRDGPGLSPRAHFEEEADSGCNCATDPPRNGGSSANHTAEAHAYKDGEGSSLWTPLCIRTTRNSWKLRRSYHRSARPRRWTSRVSHIKEESAEGAQTTSRSRL